MNKTSILYISYDGLTDPLGQSQVLPYLIGLSQKGYKISVLSTEKEENFKKNKATIESICKEGELNWQYIYYTKTPPVVSTIKDVKNLVKKAEELHITEKFQIVHCRSYISALVGLRMKKKFRTKFLFDMRGFWADERIDGGIWDLKNPVFKFVYNYFKKKEKAFLANADQVVSLTYNGKNEMANWENGMAIENKTNVIPCCADLEHFNYNEVQSDASNKQNLGIPENHKVITYLGSVGTWYMLEEMLDYFKVHVKKFPLTTFLWITKDDPNMILNAAKERGLSDNIVIQGSERKDLPGLLSICDASIFFIKPLFSKKASSPTKMAELLGMGVPLICNSNVGDTDEIVKKESVGIVIENFDDQNYSNAVDQFEELLKTPKSHLRSVAQKHFSLKEGVEKYNDIYNKLK